MKCPGCNYEILLPNLEKGAIVSDYSEESYEENHGKFIEFEYFTFCPNCYYSFCNRSLTKTNYDDLNMFANYDYFSINMPMDIIDKLLKFETINDICIESNNNYLNIVCKPVQMKILDGDLGTTLFVKEVE